MARWFWPRMSRETTVLRRLGRVLFWGGLVFAALFTALGLSLLISGDGQPADSIGLGLALAIPPYALGRGLCYILAGE